MIPRIVDIAWGIGVVVHECRKVAKTIRMQTDTSAPSNFVIFLPLTLK